MRKRRLFCPRPFHPSPLLLQGPKPLKSHKPIIPLSQVCPSEPELGGDGAGGPLRRRECVEGWPGVDHRRHRTRFGHIDHRTRPASVPGCSTAARCGTIKIGSATPMYTRPASSVALLLGRRDELDPEVPGCRGRGCDGQLFVLAQVVGEVGRVLISQQSPRWINQPVPKRQIEAQLAGC